MTQLEITDAIDALIRLGNEENGELREELMRSSELQRRVLLLQSLVPSPSDVAQQLAPLSISQHAALARGLIRVEEAYGMTHGSVDVAIQVYSSFALKFPDAADALAEWMLAHSTNECVPFGTMRFTASSPTEYHRHRERRVVAIATLIRLGNEESDPVREALMVSSELQEAVSFLQSLDPFRSDVAQQLAPLSISQHAALIWGLLLVKEACGMRYGSVDVAIQVNSSFAMKFPYAADQIPRRIPDVPSGHTRYGFSFFPQYRQYSRHSERGFSFRAENAIKKAKEAVGNRVASYRDRIQREAAEARQDFIDEISRLSAGECLEHLAWDDSHPLSYYPASLAESAQEAWWIISDEARQALLAKAATTPSGEWREWWWRHKSG